MRFKSGVLVAAVLLVGCGGSDPIEPVPTDPQDVTYAAELNVDFNRMTRSASGLWFEDVVVGTGDLPLIGEGVDVLYTGYLPTGVVFDSALDPDDPFFFILGVDNIILGFAEGVAGMRPGGMRRLVIPPQLGYGSRAFGPIPGNSVLVFDVELLAPR